MQWSVVALSVSKQYFPCLSIQPSHATSPIRRSLSFFGSVEAEPGASLADFSLDRVVPVMIQSREPSPDSSASSFGEGKVWEQARSTTEILSGMYVALLLSL